MCGTDHLLSDSPLHWLFRDGVTSASQHYPDPITTRRTGVNIEETGEEENTKYHPFFFNFELKSETSV